MKSFSGITVMAISVLFHNTDPKNCLNTLKKKFDLQKIYVLKKLKVYCVVGKQRVKELFI